MRRLLPRSLAGQVQALVASAILLTHVALVATVLFGWPQLLAGEGGSPVVGSLAALHRLSQALPPGEVTQAAAVLLPGAKLMPAEAATRLGAGTPDQQLLLGTLQAAVPGDGQAGLVRLPGQGAPLLSVRLADGRLLAAAMPADMRPPVLPLLLLASSLATTLLLLSGWAALQLSAPLTRFSAAAEQFGSNLAGTPLPEQGPAEVARAAAAFNRMRDRIRRLVEDRTHMLAAISHDLRTPLTRLQLRLEAQPDAALRRDALADLQGMERLIHAALDYLRDGAQPLRAVAVDLPALLQTVASEASDLGHDVGYEGPAHATLACDPDLLHRALTNLVDNACRHARVVRIGLTFPAAEKACIEVADDGPGIPEVDRARMLEPFHQGDPARQDGGFGLGLPIAQRIVGRHGGMMALGVAKEGGLLVRMTLPAGGITPRAHDTRPQ